MLIRQSTIKAFAECPLRVKFQQEGAVREQSSAASFGTCIHDATMAMEQAHDLQVGLDRWKLVWADPGILGVAYDYMMPRNSHNGYYDMGRKILEDWWELISWESDKVLAREYQFRVPLMGGHELTGTADKVALRQRKGGEWIVLISDYKTNAKQPTRDYLQHDVQFHSYCYASTQPEFWTGIPNGQHLYEATKDWRRAGEWVHLRTTKRLDAGFREQMHYNRLAYAVDQIEKSQALGIYVPNISGATCEFCEFRLTCGLPSRAEEGLE
jgi:RecB family exonuclease